MGYSTSANPTAPSPQATLKGYAEYERSRGGALYVLQAGLLVVQSFVVSRLPAGEWAPLGLLPLYALYFILRWPVWLRVYRQGGHVELRKEVSTSRRHAWLLPVVTTLVFLFIWRIVSWSLARRLPDAPALDPWPWVGWNLVFWAILLVGGRLPADWGFCWAHSLVVAGVFGFMGPSGWAYYVAGLAAVILAVTGLAEHDRWLDLRARVRTHAASSEEARR